MKGVGRRAVYVVDKSGVIRYKWVAEAPDQQPDYAALKQVASSLN